MNDLKGMTVRDRATNLPKKRLVGKTRGLKLLIDVRPDEKYVWPQFLADHCRDSASECDHRDRIRLDRNVLNNLLNWCHSSINRDYHLLTYP